MQVTPSVDEHPTRPYLYRLVGVGVALILLAVVVQQVMLHTISGVRPIELVSMHNQAVASLSSSAAGPGYANIGLSAPSEPAPSRSPLMVELDGAPALWLQYMVSGRPVSVLYTGHHSVNLRGMQKVAAYGKLYHLKQMPAGNVLVDSSGDIWGVAISNATPQEMLPVLRRLPDFPSYRASM